MIEKYKWKCRLLLVKTPNYKNPQYLKTKKLYQKAIKGFHKRSIKLISKISKNHFTIDLIGFDGKKKSNFKTINIKKIFKLVDQMPISKKIRPLNLSLFSDYNPKTTTQGLGFKNKEKAIYTIDKIKNRDLKYQVNVIATMMGRAKKHPNRTEGMNEAINVFNTWMKNYKKNKIKN